jgi:hypothetical protein
MVRRPRHWHLVSVASAPIRDPEKLPILFRDGRNPGQTSHRSPKRGLEQDEVPRRWRRPGSRPGWDLSAAYGPPAEAYGGANPLAAASAAAGGIGAAAGRGAGDGGGTRRPIPSEEVGAALEHTALSVMHKEWPDRA